MRLGISNIAWNYSDDEIIVPLLHRYNIDAIDIAPSKYFPVPAEASYEDISRVRNWWFERGIEITGMQALMFGAPAMNLFGSEDVQEDMLSHLREVCRIGIGLGAKNLVFGSPKTRDRSGLDNEEAMERAVSFFLRLGDICKYFGVTICLEPNPSCYGSNFMMTSSETAQVVRQIAHPNIKMQFDTGAITINGEDPFYLLDDCSEIIGHIHLSEPDLLPIGDGGADHLKLASATNIYLPDKLITIEMLSTKCSANLADIERAIDVAIQYYCSK